MESGRFLSIEIVNTTIQQYIDNYDWSAIIAAALATHNASAAAHAAAIGAHDAGAAAHLGGINVPCLYLALTNQNIPGNVQTALSWETEVYDTEDFWDAGDPTNINIPAAKKGLYLVSLYLFPQYDQMGNWFIALGYLGANNFIHSTYASDWTHSPIVLACHAVVTEASALHFDILTDQYAGTVVLEYAEVILTRLRAI